MTSESLIVGVAGIELGALASWLITRHYSTRSDRGLKDEFTSLKREIVTLRQEVVEMHSSGKPVPQEKIHSVLVKLDTLVGAATLRKLYISGKDLPEKMPEATGMHLPPAININDPPKKSAEDYRKPD